MAFPIEPRGLEHDTAFRRSLMMMHKSCRQYEIAFHSFEAIEEWLQSMRVPKGDGEHVVDLPTIKHWVKKRGFPVFVLNKRSGVFTTNLMILAWFASYRRYRDVRRQTWRRRDLTGERTSL